MLKKLIQDLFSPKRKRIFINPKFQWFLIGYFTIISLALLWVYYLMNNYYSQQMQINVQTIFDNNNGEPGEIVNSILMAQSDFLLWSYLFTGGLILLAIFMGAFYISHRIAGPIYRINASMDDYLLRKKISPVKLRDQDFFLDLATKFNQLLAQLPNEGQPSEPMEQGQERGAEQCSDKS